MIVCMCKEGLPRERPWARESGRAGHEGGMGRLAGSGVWGRSMGTCALPWARVVPWAWNGTMVTGSVKGQGPLPFGQQSVCVYAEGDMCLCLSRVSRLVWETSRFWGWRGGGFLRVFGVAVRRPDRGWCSSLDPGERPRGPWPLVLVLPISVLLDMGTVPTSSPFDIVRHA